MSGPSLQNLPRVNTLPPQLLNRDNAALPANNINFERSKTERQRHNILSEEAAQIFDDKIPVQQKVSLDVCFLSFHCHQRLASV